MRKAAQNPHTDACSGRTKRPRLGRASMVVNSFTAWLLNTRWLATAQVRHPGGCVTAVGAGGGTGGGLRGGEGGGDCTACGARTGGGLGHTVASFLATCGCSLLSWEAVTGGFCTLLPAQSLVAVGDASQEKNRAAHSAAANKTHRRSRLPCGRNKLPPVPARRDAERKGPRPAPALRLITSRGCCMCTQGARVAGPHMSQGELVATRDGMEQSGMARARKGRSKVGLSAFHTTAAMSAPFAVSCVRNRTSNSSVSAMGSGPNCSWRKCESASTPP